MGSILSWEERLGLYMVSGREKYGKYTELGGEVRAIHGKWKGEVWEVY